MNDRLPLPLLMDPNPYAAPVSDVTTTQLRTNFTDLPFKQLKKLRNDSHSIRAFIALLFLGTVISLISSFVKLPELNPVALAGFAVAALLVVTAVGLIIRSSWGRILGMIVA